VNVSPRKAHQENDARGGWHALRRGTPQGVKPTDNAPQSLKARCDLYPSRGSGEAISIAICIQPKGQMQHLPALHPTQEPNAISCIWRVVQQGTIFQSVSVPRTGNKFRPQHRFSLCSCGSAQSTQEPDAIRREQA